MYKTFTEWKNGNWLEDGEPRKKAYTKDELLLVEMGWKYGFDAGKAQTKPLSDEEIEKTFDNTFKVRDFDGEFLRFARAIEERHGIK
jgi:hypothetical protein